jgi:hypothetical protein
VNFHVSFFNAFANVGVPAKITLYAVPEEPLNASVSFDILCDGVAAGQDVCERPPTPLAQGTITRSEDGTVFYLEPIIFKEPSRGKTFHFFFQLLQGGQAGDFCEVYITVNQVNTVPATHT